MSSPLFNSGQALGRQRKIFFKGYWESIVLYGIKSQFLFQVSMYGHQRKKTVCWCDELGGWHWYIYTAAAAKLLQVVSDSVRPQRQQPTRLPHPWDSPGKNTEWVAISFSNAWKWKVKVKSLSHVRLSATPWTAAHQAPPSMGFSRQKYWTGMPLPSPIYTLLGIKYITNKSLRIAQETLFNALVMKRELCTHRVDSVCCTAESNTTLWND